MDPFVTSGTGVRMPRILYGTAWKKDETEGLVRTAIAEGFRGIDTACQPRHYYEAGVGAALSPNGRLARRDLYLQTKFTPLSGQDPARVPYDPEASLAGQVHQSCGMSLQNLRTDYLDCLLLHSPLPKMTQTLEVWRAMESLVAAHSVRQLGISNCTLGQLQRLCDAAALEPAVVQNRFYADNGYDRDIRAFCRQRRIIYQSFWTLTANAHILSHGTVSRLSRRYGRTPPQILFRYLTQIGVVPLTGARTPTHMREDLSIFEFELADAERQTMEALF
jgi:diketogulonate reductase-like aldo/keto reductase